MPMTVPQLKRKLRQLKRMEMTFRFGREPAPNHPPLVWDIFFSTQTPDLGSVKYPLPRLMSMERDEFQAAIDEYFLRLYSTTAQDTVRADVHDPELLAWLGLPPYAGMAEIVQRFRVLAKQYHPDYGGESRRFIELVTVYERLRNETS